MSATFSVRDPGLAAWLRFRGHSLVTVVRDRRRRKRFIFEDGPERQADMLVYLDRHSVDLSPREFMDAVRAVESLAATAPPPLS
jgi:hypothetical protein